MGGVGVVVVVTEHAAAEARTSAKMTSVRKNRGVLCIMLFNGAFAARWVTGR